MQQTTLPNNEIIELFRVWAACKKLQLAVKENSGISMEHARKKRRRRRRERFKIKAIAATRYAPIFAKTAGLVLNEHRLHRRNGAAVELYNHRDASSLRSVTRRAKSRGCRGVWRWWKNDRVITRSAIFRWASTRRFAKRLQLLYAWECSEYREDRGQFPFENACIRITFNRKHKTWLWLYSLYCVESLYINFFKFVSTSITVQFCLQCQWNFNVIYTCRKEFTVLVNIQAWIRWTIKEQEMCCKNCLHSRLRMFLIKCNSV